MKSIFTAIIASLLLMKTPQALALGGDHKDYVAGESISHPDNWPPRLLELANLPSRVAGSYINSDDSLAFKGDTVAFQSFLDACAALGEFGPTTLHIHKGKGSFQPLDKEKKAMPCDWQLDVLNQEWRSTVLDPRGAMKRLELHVWLEGAVDFTAVKVPGTVRTTHDDDPPATSQAAPVFGPVIEREFNNEPGNLLLDLDNRRFLVPPAEIKTESKEATQWDSALGIPELLFGDVPEEWSTANFDEWKSKLGAWAAKSGGDLVFGGQDGNGTVEVIRFVLLPGAAFERIDTEGGCTWESSAADVMKRFDLLTPSMLHRTIKDTSTLLI